MWVRALVRIGWAALALVLVTFGVVGVQVTPVGLLVFWGLLGPAAGIAVWKTTLVLPAVQRLVGPRRPDVWSGTAVALAFIVLCLAVAGMATVADALTVTILLGAVLAVSGWFGWRLWRGTYAERPGDDVVELTSFRPPTMLRTLPTGRDHDLSTEELCLVWRCSYVQLQRAADEPARQRIIRARQECLDELERRDRAGFARWLASGARAGSNPRRYLSPGG
ncbi:hypothetical protein KUTG_02404 [Kutzneria sp. 744]|nr:hypothetical protein KUTG_02404 [Kutzneria sp. 744]